MNKVNRTLKTVAEGLRNAVITTPEKVKKEIFPDENYDPSAKHNEQEDYPGVQPDLKTKDKFKKIGK
jgi:hypothetical protein